jgi:hypothetical protein
VPLVTTAAIDFFWMLHPVLRQRTATTTAHRQ